MYQMVTVIPLLVEHSINQLCIVLTTAAVGVNLILVRDDFLCERLQTDFQTECLSKLRLNLAG